MKKGLVLEGGGMRGLFSEGFLDVMLEAGIKVDGMIGVSAGALFGCNFKSHQPGRGLRYNIRFLYVNQIRYNDFLIFLPSKPTLRSSIWCVQISRRVSLCIGKSTMWRTRPWSGFEPRVRCPSFPPLLKLKGGNF